MYRNCTQEKAVFMQKKYEQCLLELLSERPYAEVTINDICARMGTSRKSFYHFFNNKQGCLCALIDRLFFEFLDFQTPEHVDLKGYPRRLINQMLYQMEKQDVMEVLIRNDLFGLLIDRLVICIKENTIVKANMADTFEEDAILFYMCGVMAVRRSWHESGYQRSIYEVAESISRLATPQMLENW